MIADRWRAIPRQNFDLSKKRRQQIHIHKRNEFVWDAKQGVSPINPYFPALSTSGFVVGFENTWEPQHFYLGALTCLKTSFDLVLTPLTDLLMVLLMAITHPVLADISAGISELKKNPMAVVAQGDGAPIAILNRNEPVFYAVPAQAYELLMDRLEDLELAAIVEARKNQPEIEIDIDDL